MPSKPMQRTLEKLRAEGWVCHIVEKFNRFSMRRVDAFGFGDILAMRPGEIALVQTTDGTSFSKHRKKITDLLTYRQWYEAGGTVILHGWYKRKRRDRVWYQCREQRTPLRNADDIAIDIVAELRFRKITGKLLPEQGLELRKTIAEIVTKGWNRTVKSPRK